MEHWTASELTDTPSLAIREPDRHAAIRVLGRLTPAELSLADLRRRTDYNLFDLRRADLHRANLSLGYFDGTDFSYADLRGSNLSGGRFEAANFVWATLAGANLAGANLSGACFLDADLRGSNFTGSVLVGAIFHGADISTSTFDRADIRGLDFALVDSAAGATFEQCILDAETRLPDLV